MDKKWGMLIRNNHIQNICADVSLTTRWRGQWSTKLKSYGPTTDIIYKTGYFILVIHPQKTLDYILRGHQHHLGCSQSIFTNFQFSSITKLIFINTISSIHRTEGSLYNLEESPIQTYRINKSTVSVPWGSI